MDTGSGEILEGGETPETSTRQRAAHWLEFYERLIAFESEILTTMQEVSSRLSTEEARAVEITNITPMPALIAAFKLRADVWREVA